MKTVLNKVLREMQINLVALNDEFLDEFLAWYEVEYKNKTITSMSNEMSLVKNKVNEILIKTSYEAKILKEIGASAYIATGEGVVQGGKNFIVGKTEYEDYFLKKPYKGRSLSPRVHTGAIELRRKVEEITRENLQLKTSYKSLQKKFLSENVSDRSTLPKVYEQLEATINELGIDNDQTKSLLKIAKEQSKKLKLAKGETGKLRKAYESVIESIENEDVDLFRKRIQRAQKAKINYNNLRLARTEMQRSYDEGFNRAMQENDEIWGYKLSLSPRHPKPDMCDVYTQIDFGYGPGIYPKSQMVELPLHPNCICRKEAIYAKPKGEKFEYNNEAVYKYLDSLDEQTRMDILGVHVAQNRNLWRAGLLKKNILAPVNIESSKKILKRFIN